MMRVRIGTLPTPFQQNTNVFSTHASPPSLPGYTFEDDLGRYRSGATGRFVARKDILSLTDAQINASEARMTSLTTAVMEGRITPAVWQEAMRTEAKQQVLSQAALGSGGWDRISQQSYGRAGADLRQLYGKISGTAQDIADGKISMAQAQARANEYAGHGRSHFYEAEREKVKPSASNKVFLERRMLGGGGRTCSDCVSFYDAGWQPFGLLPAPGVDSVCRGNCKCVLIRMEVESGTEGDWIGTKR
jgi:hypothetical protein